MHSMCRGPIRAVGGQRSVLALWRGSLCGRGGFVVQAVECVRAWVRSAYERLGRCGSWLCALCCGRDVFFDCWRITVRSCSCMRNQRARIAGTYGDACARVRGLRGRSRVRRQCVVDGVRRRVCVGGGFWFVHSVRGWAVRGTGQCRLRAVCRGSLFIGRQHVGIGVQGVEHVWVGVRPGCARDAELGSQVCGLCKRSVVRGRRL